MVSQIDSDSLRKMRNKHVNIMVHVYGRAISSKPVHQKMSSVLLQPANRDRAGAHSTVSQLEFVRKLKQVHGTYLTAHTSSWAMWANAIHSSPAHRQESMMTDLPPAHLVHLFRSVPTAEIEVMQAAQNGLHIADNLNDIFAESLASIHEELRKFKEAALRGIELIEIRLQSAEDLMRANSRMVSAMNSALHVQVNAASLSEERQVYENDIPDLDHE